MGPRINRGGRSRLGSQSNGSALGGPGPHSRRPDHAGGVRRGDGLHGIDDNEEVDSRRGHPRHPRRPFNRGQGIGAPLDGLEAARGPPQEDSAEDRVDPRGPTQPRVGRQNVFGQHENHRGGRMRAPLGAQSNQSRGGRPDNPSEHPGFGDQNDDIGDLPLPGFAGRQPFEAAGAHSGRRHPSSQRPSHVSQGRESFGRSESHGGSRRGAGNRARSLSIDAHDEGDAGPSNALIKHPGAKNGKGSKEKEGRFIPYTFRTLPSLFADCLAKVFKVRLSKIREWCDDDLIRLDKKSNGPNIDLLLDRMPSKDREWFEKEMKKIKNEKEIERRVGSNVPTEYERGFYAGQSIALYGRGSGGYGRGWPR